MSLISARSRVGRSAWKRADWHAVVLVGPPEPVPRKMGDNRGGWPIEIVVTKKEMTAGDAWDRKSPYYKPHELESAYVVSEQHGKLAKTALNHLLLGAQEEQENEPARRMFRDVMGCFECETTRSIWWGLMLEEAAAFVISSGWATAFRFYSAEEAQAVSQKRMIRTSGMRGMEP